MVNDRGMRAAAITHGATVTAIEVPDRNGVHRNIVLSLPDMARYEATERRWAGIVGRYAGRIDHASFALGGKTYRLEPGRNGVTLHSGSNAYDKRLWRYRTASDANSLSTIFTLVSPDGDQGFPGRVSVTVRYRLMRKTNELRLEYEATTTKPTVINLTNHMFVNLGGAASGTVGRHRLTIAANRYAETDARKVPTGRLLPVAGTPLDFRRSTAIGSDLASDDPLLAPSKGFDHSFVLAGHARTRPQPAAIVNDPVSGRVMSIATTEPSLQFNSGNGFDGSEVGSEGVAYPIYAGLALETQHLPDSPNQPEFPSTVLTPDAPFRSVTIYRFSTDRPKSDR